MPNDFDLSNLTPEHVRSAFAEVEQLSDYQFEQLIEKINVIANDNLDKAAKWASILRTMNSVLTTVRIVITAV